MTSEEKESLQKHYKESGFNGVARFMIAKAEVRSKEKYVSPTELSLYYVLLGDYERALGYLEKAYQMRSPAMVRIEIMPVFEALHSEPRFKALLKKVGLKE